MNKENINIEYVNEENSRFLKNILRLKKGRKWSSVLAFISAARGLRIL